MYRSYAGDTMAKKQPKRNLILGTDGGLEANYAFTYLKDNVYKEEDQVVLVYTHRLTVQNADLLNSDEKRIVKLINEETKRVETVVRLLQKKLNDAKINGKIVIGIQGVSPAQNILNTAKELNAAMVVVGSRGLGEELTKLLGSTSNEVVSKSHIPVLVCKI